VSDITLYSKPDCHLCDLAYTLLVELNLTVSVIDIRSDSELMKKYGELIPVAVLSDGTTLNWPFDKEAIHFQLAQA